MASQWRRKIQNNIKFKKRARMRRCANHCLRHLQSTRSGQQSKHLPSCQSHSFSVQQQKFWKWKMSFKISSKPYQSHNTIILVNGEKFCFVTHCFWTSNTRGKCFGFACCLLLPLRVACSCCLLVHRFFLFPPSEKKKSFFQKPSKTFWTTFAESPRTR